MTNLVAIAPFIRSGGLSPLGVFSSHPAPNPALESSIPPLLIKLECQEEATVLAPLFLPNVLLLLPSSSVSNTLEATERVGDMSVEEEGEEEGDKDEGREEGGNEGISGRKRRGCSGAAVFGRAESVD